VDRRTGEITCLGRKYDSAFLLEILDPYFKAPDSDAAWNEGYGPGEVPGCRRAVCECDKAQVNKLKKGTLT